MNDNNANTIKFEKELVTRLNAATATANAAVAEAALAAVAQDRKVSVRAFAGALRAVAPALGTNNAVLAAAVKAAKVDKATAVDVAEAMASALEKKRKDDRKRAADKAAAKPGKDLERAQADVDKCKLAMRTPLEVARDEVTLIEERIREMSSILRALRAERREARAKLAEIEKVETPLEA